MGRVKNFFFRLQSKLATISTRRGRSDVPFEAVQLVPKLQLGNAHSGSSRFPERQRLKMGTLAVSAVLKTSCVRLEPTLGAEAELRGRRSQAGAWERERV